MQNSTLGSKALEASIRRAKAAIAATGAVYPQGAVDGVNDMIALGKRVLAGEYQRPFSHSRHYLPQIDNAAFVNRFNTMITGWQVPYDMERTYGMADAAAWIGTQNLAAMTPAVLRAKAHELTDRAHQVLKDAVPGRELGNIAPAACEELQSALAAVEALNSEVADAQADVKKADTVDISALAGASARLANAIRDALASTVLVFDIDPKANLFLNGADSDSLAARINADPFLADQYQQIKAVADQWTADDVAFAADQLQRDQLDYAALNARFPMWSSSETTFNFVTPADAVAARVELKLDAAANAGSDMERLELWVDDLRVFAGTGGDWPIVNAGFDDPGQSDADGAVSAGAAADATAAADNAPAGWHDASVGGACARRDANQHNGAAGASLHLACPAGSAQANNNGKDIDGAQAPVAKAVSLNPIAIEPNQGTTATFMLKIDGVMPVGLDFTIHFLNASGEECGVFERTINRSSYLRRGPGMALSCQADAIVAFVEHNQAYAEKAKREIFLELDEFCQGAEHWMVNNCRPYGADAYGAVQAGRIMCSVAAAYSLICDNERFPGLFSSDETRRLLNLCDYMLLYVTDSRDRTALTGDEVQLGATNWQTDMMAGAAVLSLVLLQAGVLPSEERKLKARRTVQDSAWFLSSQLNDHVNPDGSFPESLRYHMAALSRYTFVARVLGHCTGADWYKTTRLRDMFQYYADMVTPDYPFSNTKIPSQPGEAEPLSAASYEAGCGVPSTPTFGDHQVGNGSEFAQLGLCAGDVARVDGTLSRQMLATWKRAGKPVAPFWTESVAFEHLLLDATAADTIDTTGAGDWGPLTSNLDYPDSGICLFRKGFDQPHEQMLAVMASPKPIGHGHFDEGSFILYKDRVLTVADPGIIGYFDSSKDWLVSSSAHATMQFASRTGARARGEVRADRLDLSNYSIERGWVDTPRTARVLNTSFGGDVERIDIEIDNAQDVETGHMPVAKHRRTVLWFPEPELMLVHDSMSDFDGTIRFNLPIAARVLPQLPQLPSQSGKSGAPVDVRHVCNYGLSLQTTFLTPLTAISTEWGLSSPVAPKVDGKDQLEFLRAETDAANGFTVLINAMRAGEPEANATIGADGAVYLTKGAWHGVATF
ncbi:heparinase II/III domain-containing protein [Bifidobacterium oedipodis]|uniref:Heparinase n=1 Tax=Bifidobacterium oedipodis TaxID=2675322 RepID=A0A7Y0EPT1_9BIFI|nr:heparinase II/III family protein [Bifidobacterium sp. DSM 109957]NMM94117.1 heparinase [Bifidobacterium sp. DSM 109957]